MDVLMTPTISCSLSLIFAWSTIIPKVVDYYVLSCDFCYCLLVTLTTAVRLGGMLGFSQMDEEGLSLLLSHIHYFLRYSN